VQPAHGAFAPDFNRLPAPRLAGAATARRNPYSWYGIEPPGGSPALTTLHDAAVAPGINLPKQERLATSLARAMR
jgi:hypothetical protein